jgi:Glycosyltransferase family 87
LPEAGAVIKANQAGSSRKFLGAARSFLIIALCGIPFALLAIGFVYTAVAHPGGSRDFIVYWATGRQLVRHANPYDPHALQQLEDAAGLPAHYGAKFMRNPPTALLLVYPLGFFDLRSASILWSAASVLCFLLAVYIAWSMHGRRRNFLSWLGYSFAPALVCLLNGQSALFALLGLALFLRLYRARPLLAGIFLSLCAIKPHLFLPFGLVLLLWIVVTRSYTILIGAAFAAVNGLAITSFIDPQVWPQYVHMMRTSGVAREFIPCVSDLMRIWFPPHAVWQEYVLALLASIWAIDYYWKRRANWSWTTDGSLLILVSLVAAPYSWLSDQALVLPALLHGVYVTRSRNLVNILALLSTLIEAFLFFNLGHPAAFYYWTIWAAPAWLAWYLLAMRFPKLIPNAASASPKMNQTPA